MRPYWDAAMWNATWPLIAVSVILGAIVAIAGKRARYPWFSTFIVLSSLSMLGSVIGTLLGFSRIPAHSSVLPVLGLTALLVIYIISRASEETRMLVSLCVFCLSVAVWIGAAWGAGRRGDFLEYNRSEAYLKKRADIEKAVRSYRERLGLPPNFEIPDDK